MPTKATPWGPRAVVAGRAWGAKAGNPPELAQDNPPPLPDGSTLNQLLALVPPGLVVSTLSVLILSQIFYAVLPYRRRAYVPALFMTALGFAAGQLWDYAGLPSLRLGQADMVPAVIFALALQPLSRFIPTTERQPREPKAQK